MNSERHKLILATRKHRYDLIVFHSNFISRNYYDSIRINCGHRPTQRIQATTIDWHMANIYSYSAPLATPSAKASQIRSGRTSMDLLASKPAHRGRSPSPPHSRAPEWFGQKRLWAFG